MKNEMKTKNSRSSLLIGMALMGAGISALPAQQLFYQLIETGTHDDFRNSDGTLQPIGMDYHAGYFIPGFTPDATNFSTWDANWTTVSSTPLWVYPISAPQFTAVSEQTDIFSVPANSQVYLWGSQGMTDPTVEQLLLTNSDLLSGDGTKWIFSTPSANGSPVPSVSISGGDDNVYAVVGAYEGVAGGGIISDLIPSGSSHVQSARISAVPEPSSALLAAMGSLFFLRRKRSQ